MNQTSRRKLLIFWTNQLKNDSRTHYDNYINSYFSMTYIDVQRAVHTFTVLHTIHDDNGLTIVSISLEWVPHGQKKNG